MIVSHKLKYVYIAIPKTGSSTMNDLLCSEFAGEYIIPHHLTIIPDDCRDYFVFTVVRNPYVRLKSLWKHARRHVNHRLHGVAKSQTLLEFSLWHGDRTIEPEVKAQSIEYTYLSDSFNLDRFKGREPSQLDFLSELYVHEVLKLESIETDFGRLPFANHSPSRPVAVFNQDPDGSNTIDDCQLDGTSARAIHEWAWADFMEYGYRMIDV